MCPGLPRLLVLKLVSSTTHKYLLNPTVCGPLPSRSLQCSPVSERTDVHGVGMTPESVSVRAGVAALMGCLGGRRDKEISSSPNT